jgi:hypothetical protein
MLHQWDEYSEAALASGLARSAPAASVGTPSAGLDGQGYRCGRGRHQGRGQLAN